VSRTATSRHLTLTDTFHQATYASTSALLRIIEDEPGMLLANLGMSDMRASRFAWYAAPRRIEIDPQLAK
jgi:hypothetical protein